MGAPRIPPLMKDSSRAMDLRSCARGSSTETGKRTVTCFQTFVHRVRIGLGGWNTDLYDHAAKCTRIDSCNTTPLKNKKFN